MSKKLKSSIGNPAEGKNKFFKRKQIVQRIRSYLESDMNLLLSAPRRIGKTSILKHIIREKRDHEIIKYIIVQSVHLPNQFYKRVFNELVNDDEIYSVIDQAKKKGWEFLQEQAKRIRGISTKGVDLSNEAQINYFESVNTIFDELSKQGKAIWLFIDEFPDAVNNILNSENGEKISLEFLQQHRELREKYSNSKIRFVYTGSTGLRNVVARIGEPSLTNDLKEIKVPPFNQDEARALIDSLVLGKQESNQDFTLADNVIDHILSKIEWLLPYFIQIVIDDLYHVFLDKQEPISNDTVDQVINELISANSNHADYFEHWKIRLNRAFNQNQRKLAYETLSQVSKEGSITKNIFFDLSKKHKVNDHAYVLKVLLHDGYLILDEAENNMGFHSFILKEWWYKNA